MADADLQKLKVGTSLVVVTIIGEPYVTYTKFGYGAVVNCKDIYTGQVYALGLSAVSIADPIEKRRLTNNGVLDGLTIGLRRESDDKKAKYIISDVDN